MSDWISVADRLPDRDVSVLVLGRDGSMSVRYIPSDRDSWYPGGWGVGWTTHWMPLPEPPQ